MNFSSEALTFSESLPSQIPKKKEDQIKVLNAWIETWRRFGKKHLKNDFTPHLSTLILKFTLFGCGKCANFLDDNVQVAKVNKQ